MDHDDYESYLKLLEKTYANDISELHDKLANVEAERDQLKQQLATALGNVSSMTEKAEAANRQLRHV